MGSIRRKDRVKIFKYGMLLAVFVLGFALYYSFGRKTLVWYNSDSAFSVIAGKDMISGNILLKDWYGARNTLYALNIVYGLLGAFFGYSFHLILVTSALLWAGFLTLIAAIIFWRYNERPIQCIMRICFVFTLCFSSCYVRQGYGIFGGTHFDLVLIGIFYAWIISKEIEGCNKNSMVLSAIAICLLFFSIWSDELTTLLIVMPILIALMFELLFCNEETVRRIYIVKWLILTVLTFAAAKGSLLFFQNTGRMITATPVGGVTVPEYTELFTNIAYFFKSILYLFSCDLFGQHVEAGSGLLLLRLLFLLVLFVGLLFNLKRIVSGLFNRILLFSIAIEFLVNTFTEAGADKAEGPGWTSRLLICLFFSLVLLFAQIDWESVVALIKIEISGKGWKAFGAVTILLLLGLSLQELRYCSPNKANVSSIETCIPLGDALVDRDLTRGFGTYWLSSGVTLASDFKVDVAPVIGEDLSSFHWLSKSTKDWDYANFVLVDKSGWGGVTEENIIEDIGIPSEKISVNDATILVWDKNIMPYIKDSGYPGETLVGWWSLEPGQTEKTIETTSRHFNSQFAANKDGYFTSDAAGYVLYGPYMSMSEGTYDITFEYDYAGTLGPGELLGQVDASSNAQKVRSASCAAVAGENSVTMRGIQVLPECTDFETRFYANVEGITVRRITVKRTGM